MDYATILAQLPPVLEGCPDFTSALASAAALLKENLPRVSWAGFYLPRPDGSLVVGPYQGPLACTVLPAGRGVCAAAAARRETVVVDDVESFDGHIACDPRAKSEIVVPILKDGELRAVMDLDSTEPAAFNADDRRNLEAVAALLASK